MITLETKSVVTLELEEYNSLRKAAPYKKLLENGFVDIEIVCYYKSFRITLPESTLLKDLVSAATILLSPPTFGQQILIRNADGMFLEQGRTLKELGITKYGERLFLN